MIAVNIQEIATNYADYAHGCLATEGKRQELVNGIQLKAREKTAADYTDALYLSVVILISFRQY